MCTVTYIPPSKDHSFVLTSNRDEREFRPTIPPEVYDDGDGKLAFPKDATAGGSWIAINHSGHINCLLNGGFVAHQKQEYHTESRGTVLLNFTRSGSSIRSYFENRNLVNVEPFTIVALKYTQGKIRNLTEFIWDGTDKYYRQLDTNKPYIWSSVTLYDEEDRKARKAWFERFCKENQGNITREMIFGFHSGRHTSDDTVNVVMQREGGLKTVSITQVVAVGNKMRMSYSDLLNDSYHEVEL